MAKRTRKHKNAPARPKARKVASKGAPAEEPRPLPPPEPAALAGLNAKQQRFVEEYLVDLNATRAAIRAGYAKRSASEQAYDLLRRPQIEAAIAQARAKLSEKLLIEVEDIAKEFARMGFANIFDYVRVGGDGDPYIDFSDVSRATASAIQEITVEDFVDGRGEDARDVRKVRFKLADKRGALASLSELLGYMKKRIEHSGGITVEDERTQIRKEVKKLPTEVLRKYDDLRRQQDELLKSAGVSV